MNRLVRRSASFAANRRHRTPASLLFGSLLFAAVAIGPLLLSSAPVAAQTVGDFVTNPVTGLAEQVTEVVAPGRVVTNAQNAIVLTPPVVGSTFIENGVTYTVKTLTTGSFAGQLHESVSDKA